MDIQYELPFERRCMCGKNPDPDPANCDHVRTANGWTIGFCRKECAEAFDCAQNETCLQLQLQLQMNVRA